MTALGLAILISMILLIDYLKEGRQSSQASYLYYCDELDEIAEHEDPNQLMISNKYYAYEYIGEL